MVTKTIVHCNGEILEWRWASDDEIFSTPFWTSCYYIDGILIDAGAPGGVKDFGKFIVSLGIQNIKACILTHTHEDHAGGAYLLREKFDIPVYASNKAIQILKEGYTYPEYRKIAWGPELCATEAELLPNPIISNSKEFIFDILPMPGHAPDQVAFIEKQKEWVFAADGIQMKYKRIFGESSNIQEDISLIYQSISELYNFTKDMDNLTLFLSGQDVIYGTDFIRDRLTAIDNLYQTVSTFVLHGLSIEEIEQNIFKKQDILSTFTNGELSRRNLIRSLVNWKRK
jgi:glyoxylase-like metal-dependent hydrolase (beta-lactamase superfamily II)